METQDILKLAEKHGLQLKKEISFNEMGIDFRVGFATGIDGTKWVLRIPRRTDLGAQIGKEKAILNLVKMYSSVAVPDWKIASPELVAYPLLENKPVLTFDADTHEVDWQMDKDSKKFVLSLAMALVSLHQIPTQKAASVGLKVLAPEMLRQEILERIEMVKSELGISMELETRWRQWLDNDSLWPDFTAFVHGDLYAGHILAATDGTVSGMIDWSEGQVSDPSIDFSGHLSVFGEESTRELLSEYERLGGIVWKKMFEQVVERHAVAPLNYGFFAIETDNSVHIEAAKKQLGLA